MVVFSPCNKAPADLLCGGNNNTRDKTKNKANETHSKAFLFRHQDHVWPPFCLDDAPSYSTIFPSCACHWMQLSARSDHDLDHIGPNLPLWYVQHDLHSTDPTKSKHVPGQPDHTAPIRQHDLDRSDEKCYLPCTADLLSRSGNRASVWGVKWLRQWMQRGTVPF